MMDELQKLKDIAKREWQRNLAALAKMRADQAAEAEAARIEADRIANLPTPETTSYPVNGLQFTNGIVVDKPTVQPSIAISRTATFTELNQQALSKRK
jgi:hypothetical protein